METIELRINKRLRVGCMEFAIMSDGSLFCQILSGGFVEVKRVLFWRVERDIFFAWIDLSIGRRLPEMDFSQYTEAQFNLKKYYDYELPELEIGDSHVLEFTED